MAPGAPVRATFCGRLNDKAHTTQTRQVSIVDKLKLEIRHLDQAAIDEAALDAFIDSCQTVTDDSRISKGHTVQESLEKVIGQLEVRLNDIDVQLELLRESLGKFGDAVMRRCTICSANDDSKVVVSHKVRAIEQLILTTKERIISMDPKSSSTSLLNELKIQVEKLEVLKADIQDEALECGEENERFNAIMNSEGGRLVLSDVLKLRDEALKWQRKYKSLLEDNTKTKHKEGENRICLEDSNKELKKELNALRREMSEADLRVEQADARVQLVEEKLLEERLSHEVEVNYLKALLEGKQADHREGTTVKEEVVSDEDDAEIKRGEVRLSPEGIVEQNEYPRSAKIRVSSPRVTDQPPDDPSKTGFDNNDGDSFREWNDAFKPKEHKKQENTLEQPKTETTRQEGSQLAEGQEDENIKEILDKLQANMTADPYEGTESNSDADSDVSSVQTNCLASTKSTKEARGGIAENKEESADTENVRHLATEDNDENKIETEVHEHDGGVICIKEGKTKEIIYKRSDGDIDGELSYYKGIGAVIRTDCEEFVVDGVHCEVVDGIASDMLPDFVEGERPISFHIHFQQNYSTDFTLKSGQTLKVFVPHRPISEFEEAILVQSVEGGDWEPCEPCSGTPSSVDTNIQLVGTQLHDITDIKLVVIAREKSDSIIAGEADVSHRSAYDKSVTVNIPKETFRTRTEVKLQIHHCHREDLPTAIEVHEECKPITSCTAYVAVLCEQLTRGDMSIVLQLSNGNIDTECKYTMFSLEDSGWKLADCDWDKEGRTLTVHLRAGARKYRVVGLELPMDLSVEASLAAVKTLNNHTKHYLVRLLFRQRQEHPEQAVVLCIRSKLVKNGIHQLNELGYTVGGYPSSQFCMMERDGLTLQFTGEVTAIPVNSEKMEVTFYSQKEIATRQLRLQPAESCSTVGKDMLQGYLSILGKQDPDKVILGETINFPVGGVFSDAVSTSDSSQLGLKRTHVTGTTS